MSNMLRGENSKETLRVALDAAHKARGVLAELSEPKMAYDKEYSIFRKLLFASDKHTPLSEIMDCIDKIIVDGGGKIVVEWSTSLN